MHEDVSDWIAARGMRIDVVDADIVHLGAIPSHRDALNKRARNVALLEKRSRLEPDSDRPPRLPGHGALGGRERRGGPRGGRARMDDDRLPAGPPIGLHGGGRPGVLPGEVRGRGQAQGDPEADGGPRGRSSRLLLPRRSRRGAALPRSLRGGPKEFPEGGAPRLPGDPGGHRTGFEQRNFIGGATTWSARIRAGTVLLQLGHPGEALEEFDAALQEVPRRRGGDPRRRGSCPRPGKRSGCAGAYPSGAGAGERRGPTDGSWPPRPPSTPPVPSRMRPPFIARARSLESKGYLAPYRAARLHAMSSAAP